MHKSNEDELIKTIESFIKKSALVIINSRIARVESSDSKSFYLEDKTNSQFLTKEKERVELEEIFLDEYDELQSNKEDIKTYTLDIYFRRKEAKILIEKWTFRYKNKKTNNNESFDNFIYKKLSTLIRSIYTMTKVLPGHSFFSKKGFNYSLDFKIYTRISNQEIFMSPPKSMNFENINAVTGLEVIVQYIMKQDIFRLENECKIIEKDNKIYTRPRFLSEDNNNVRVKIPAFEIFNFEDTSINDDYFSRNNANNSNSNSKLTSNFSSFKTDKNLPTQTNLALELKAETYTTHQTHANPNSHYKNLVKKENKLHSLDEFEFEENSLNISTNNLNEKIFNNKSHYKNYIEHSSILDSLSSSSLTKTETGKINLINLINFSQNTNATNHLLDSRNLLNSFKQLGRNFYKDLKTSDTSSDQSSSESFELDIEYIDNCENSQNCDLDFNLNDNTCNEIDLNADLSVCQIRNKIHKNFLLEDVIKKFEKMRKKVKVNPTINYTTFFRIYYSHPSKKELLKNISSND